MDSIQKLYELIYIYKGVIASVLDCGQRFTGQQAHARLI